VQRWVGVEWLHLHTFNGLVHGEELPASAFPHDPIHALCVSGSSDAAQSAQWILDNIPGNPGIVHEQLGDSEAARLAYMPKDARPRNPILQVV